MNIYFTLCFFRVGLATSNLLSNAMKYTIEKITSIYCLGIMKLKDYPNNHIAMAAITFKKVSGIGTSLSQLPPLPGMHYYLGR